MGRKPRVPHHKDVLLPRLHYRQAKQSWFVYEGRAYALEQASAPLFRAFIDTYRPRTWSSYHPYLRLLKGPSIDFETKWFVLCSFYDERSFVPLYPSARAAQQAIEGLERPACSEQRKQSETTMIGGNWSKRKEEQ